MTSFDDLPAACQGRASCTMCDDVLSSCTMCDDVLASCTMCDDVLSSCTMCDDVSCTRCHASCIINVSESHM